MIRAHMGSGLGTPDAPPSDLAAEAFLVLRDAFLPRGEGVRYGLREKRNTQDDPFDEHVHLLLTNRLPGGISAVKAPGPLITPDLVVLRPALCNGAPRNQLAVDLTSIVALEVKKLERTAGGAVARASGMDYNTTPPCGTVRVYDREVQPLDIRAFYLFVCQERAGGEYRLSALTLCDGNVLNEDFDYYLSIVGARTKQIGLGTYGDGANRTRPMLIFGNPLGVEQLDRAATLVHFRDDLINVFPQLVLVGTLRRDVAPSGQRTFHCYRARQDVPQGHTQFDLVNPFPTPERDPVTQPRGRFKVDVRPGD